MNVLGGHQQETRLDDEPSVKGTSDSREFGRERKIEYKGQSVKRKKIEIEPQLQVTNGRN